MVQDALPGTRVSTAQVVAQKIRKEIIDGIRKPGDKLREVELCKQFHISRTPIREALRILQSEGFAMHNPRSSVVVSKLEAEEIEKLYEVRRTLEVLSARWAAQNITDEQIDELIAVNEQIYRSQSFDAGAVDALDIKLHRMIANAAKSLVLIEHLENLYRKAAIVTRMVPFKKEQLEHMYKEHSDIIRALKIHASEAAEKYMEIHFYNGPI